MISDEMKIADYDAAAAIFNGDSKELFKDHPAVKELVKEFFAKKFEVENLGASLANHVYVLFKHCIFYIGQSAYLREATGVEDLAEVLNDHKKALDLVEEMLPDRLREALATEYPKGIPLSGSLEAFVSLFNAIIDRNQELDREIKTLNFMIQAQSKALEKIGKKFDKCAVEVHRTPGTNVMDYIHFTGSTAGRIVFDKRGDEQAQWLYQKENGGPLLNYGEYCETEDSLNQAGTRTQDKINSAMIREIFKFVYYLDIVNADMLEEQLTNFISQDLTRILGQQFSNVYLGAQSYTELKGKG